MHKNFFLKIFFLTIATVNSMEITTNAKPGLTTRSSSGAAAAADDAIQDISKRKDSGPLTHPGLKRRDTVPTDNEGEDGWEEEETHRGTARFFKNASSSQALSIPNQPPLNRMSTSMNNLFDNLSSPQGGAGNSSAPLLLSEMSFSSLGLDTTGAINSSTLLQGGTLSSLSGPTTSAASHSASSIAHSFLDLQPSQASGLTMVAAVAASMAAQQATKRWIKNYLDENNIDVLQGLTPPVQNIFSRYSTNIQAFFNTVKAWHQEQVQEMVYLGFFGACMFQPNALPQDQTDAIAEVYGVNSSALSRVRQSWLTRVHTEHSQHILKAPNDDFTWWYFNGNGNNFQAPIVQAASAAASAVVGDSQQENSQSVLSSSHNNTSDDDSEDEDLESSDEEDSSSVPSCKKKRPVRVKPAIKSQDASKSLPVSQQEDYLPELASIFEKVSDEEFKKIIKELYTGKITTIKFNFNGVSYSRSIFFKTLKINFKVDDEEIDIIKHGYRRVKNRGYAQTARQKRKKIAIQQAEEMAKQKKELERLRKLAQKKVKE